MDPITASLAVAAVGSGIAGAMRKTSSGGPSWGEIKDMRREVVGKRTAEINAFSQALISARMKYMAQLPQFQQYTMSRFLPQLEATYAGRGLQVSGGAFGSAVGQRASDFTQEQMLEQYNRERADVSDVNSARGQLSLAELSSLPGSYATQQDNLSPFLGQLSGSFAQLAYNRAYPTDMFSGLPQQNPSTGASSSQSLPNRSWYANPYASKTPKTKLL